MDDRLYLDHAATTPVSKAAITAMSDAFGRWANPSSPHADGRAARAALEDARKRICAALDWDGGMIFTSGASEAIAIALGRSKAERILTSPIEHDAVLRVTPGRERLALDGRGKPLLPEQDMAGALVAIQHVNNETGVILPLERIAAAVRTAGGYLFADCAQSAGKLPLPDADMIAISAHKFGGPPGIGALLIRNLARIHPSGGQEQGYRAGTENLPAALAMAAALEEPFEWMEDAADLRQTLDAAIVEAGGEVVAAASPRIATIASYRMPGVSARAQLIQFDMAGISVSAGSACSSGTLKASHVLTAMGWDEAAAGEVIRVSFGPSTGAADIARFMDAWRKIAGSAPR
ncbi:aminotransferase class V-fold PLP-dependent enzyme [Sphingobium phenoxybenzoativorans]|uniref:Cysteine desulfurase n=1 Tax=Sphingobium phenoxybenzoativorans TaxID=1592790 RepID=A0A975K5Z5_9SPHN|nr:aminotransferase class V-fold PLP-dependent enzyme [Sphingobium phenoxybenzoativorans]QUT04117.1 aminotransferase class V-fold PLP-dependent enzyme [Sphingobium phenoxybenzoativorans]